MIFWGAWFQILAAFVQKLVSPISVLLLSSNCLIELGLSCPYLVIMKWAPTRKRPFWRQSNDYVRGALVNPPIDYKCTIIVSIEFVVSIEFSPLGSIDQYLVSITQWRSLLNEHSFW